MLDKSCWNCSWGRLGGITILPVCWWFVKKQGITKEVPKDIADKGCKFFTEDNIDFVEISKYLKKIKEEV